MIPIPVFWTKYTTTMQGRAVKEVTCESCSTEYLYILERETSGVGTSVYMLNENGAARHSHAAAGDTLQEVLDNDFDPVPCPACGHYQRYMFPRLRETRGLGIVLLTIALLMISAMTALGALKGSFDYLEDPTDAAFQSMINGWSVFLVVFFIGHGLTLLNQRRIRRFDPNKADQQEHIAIGRSRALTRAELDTLQQEDRTQRS